MNTDLFQPCGHCWVCQISWQIGYRTFTASPFRIWNSLPGIPSTPLALFVVMLPKAHLASHSKMSGSRWVITPSWLSESLRSFWYSSSVYSCHLFLISSASVWSIPFLSFIMPVFAWNVPLFSNFLEEISSLSHYCFPLFLCIVHLGRLSYLSLLSFGNLHSDDISFFFSLPFASLSFSDICKASSKNHFAFLHFFFWQWFWSPPLVQCYEPPSVVLQALYQI